MLRSLRTWFEEHGYLEVPTPVLVPSPAMEATLHAVRAEGGFLRTSPEFALKRVVAAGLPRIYEIGPCFRDEERGPWHGREFTLLEWYRVGASVEDLQVEVEGLVEAAARALGVPAPSRWERRSVRGLFLEHTGLDLARVDAATLSPRDAHDWDDAFFRRWIEDVEPRLPPAVFVEDWPASQAALARVRRHAPWPYAKRFEAFLGGVELANAFLELTDPVAQRARFEASGDQRIAAGYAPHPVDEAFLQAVGRMPPTAGIALGVDRLVASLLGWDGISAGRVAE